MTGTHRFFQPALIVCATLAWGLCPGVARGQCETGIHIADPGGANAWFGESLAMTDAWAVIGAYHQQPRGTAYVFRWSGRDWIPDVELPSPDDGFGSAYGFGVAILGDLAVIGAKDFDGAADRSGAAYVFERTEGEWRFLQKLVQSDPDPVDAFGTSTGIAGESILVGARGDDAGSPDGGAVYVFQLDGDVWRQTQKLFDRGGGDQFPGAALGFNMATAGNRVIVGAPFYDFERANHGAAFVYRESNGRWVFERRLTEPGDGQPDNFGLSVDISQDHAIVGAPRHVIQFRGETGAAYIYRRSGTSWSFQQAIVADESARNDRFGYSVAVEGDLILAGAWGNNDDFGSAHEFRLSGGVWSEQATIVQSDNGDPDPLGVPPRFGMELALSGDRAWIGAPHDDNPNGGDAGTAYAFSGFVDVDCNENGIPDGCDVTVGESDDENINGVPDECEPGACCTGGTCENTMRDACRGSTCVRDPEWACDGDVDGDGQVNPVDAGLAQAAFGSLREEDLCSYDVDCDGQINPVDAGIVQSLFGTCMEPRVPCPIPPRWFVGEDCGSFECP